MYIKLIRHGESQFNTGEVHTSQIGDAYIELTDKGKEQAISAGQQLGKEFLDQGLVYCSPYKRTRQTLAGLLEGAQADPEKIKVYEDPRLREIEFGYNEEDAPKSHRRKHGWFYFRHPGGESAADCYDRTSTFLESMMRQLQRKPAEKVLVVTHGLIIRCFIMRFLHLTVEEYESLFNPNNCDVITIAHKELLEKPKFTSGRWGVEGIHARSKKMSVKDRIQWYKDQGITEVAPLFHDPIIGELSPDEVNEHHDALCEISGNKTITNPDVIAAIEAAERGEVSEFKLPKPKGE